MSTRKDSNDLDRYIGRTYGDLIVLAATREGLRGTRMLRLRCSCGGEVTRTAREMGFTHHPKRCPPCVSKAMHSQLTRARDARWADHRRMQTVEKCVTEAAAQESAESKRGDVYARTVKGLSEAEYALFKRILRGRTDDESVIEAAEVARIEAREMAA